MLGDMEDKYYSNARVKWPKRNEWSGTVQQRGGRETITATGGQESALIMVCVSVRGKNEQREARAVAWPQVRGHL